MKRFLSLLAVLILCPVLCACGKSGQETARYLPEQERAALEKELADSMCLTEQNGTYSLSFRNSSKYDIYSIQLRDPNSNYVPATVTYLPGNTEIHNVSFYLTDTMDPSRPEVLMQYYIGDFAYEALEPIVLEPPVRESDSDSQEKDIELWVRTKDGDVPLPLNEELSFLTGTELPGVTKNKVFSLHTEKEYSISILGEAAKSDSWDPLILKVFDADGYIVYSTSIYISQDGTFHTSLYTLSSGTFTLVFEEK